MTNIIKQLAEESVARVASGSENSLTTLVNLRKSRINELEKRANFLDGKLVKLIQLWSTEEDTHEHFGIMDYNHKCLLNRIAIDAVSCLFAAVSYAVYEPKMTFVIEYENYTERLGNPNATRSYVNRGGIFVPTDRINDLGEIIDISEINLSPVKYLKMLKSICKRNLNKKIVMNEDDEKNKMFYKRIRNLVKIVKRKAR